MTDRRCIVCGDPVGSGSLRCIRHRGEETRRRSLVDTASRDAALLAMVDGEHLTGQRLADRLGISRTQAYAKIKLARQREAARVEMVEPKTVGLEAIVDRLVESAR